MLDDAMHVHIEDAWTPLDAVTATRLDASVYSTSAASVYSCRASQSDVKHAKSTLSQDHNRKQYSCDHIDPTCMLDAAMHMHIEDAAWCGHCYTPRCVCV